MDKNDFCQENNLSIEIDAAYKQFIKEFQELLRDRDLNQKMLAAKAGINRSSLNKFIKHQTVPTFEIVFKLLHAYLGRPPISFSKIEPALPESVKDRIKAILADLP